MKARTITLTLVAIALIAVPALTIAQGHFGGRGGHGMHGDRGGFGAGMLLGRIGDRLGLTDEQRAEIEAIFEAGREICEPLRTEMREAREAFRENHEPGAFDEVEARGFAEAQAAIHAELMVQMMKTKADIWNILTPEQQQELEELMDLFGDGKGPRRGRRGPGR